MAGEPLHANPYYAAGSLMKDYWRDGWEVAEREARPPEKNAPTRRLGDDGPGLATTRRRAAGHGQYHPIKKRRLVWSKLQLSLANFT